MVPPPTATDGAAAAGNKKEQPVVVAAAAAKRTSITDFFARAAPKRSKVRSRVNSRAARRQPLAKHRTPPQPKTTKSP
jgi:hypothetical protein